MNFLANTTFLHLFNLHQFIMRLPTREAWAVYNHFLPKSTAKRGGGDQSTAQTPDKHHLSQVI